MCGDAAHFLGGVVQVAPGLTDPVLIAAPRGFGCGGYPIADAVRGHLHRGMTSHALQALADRAHPLGHVGQGRTVVGNDNVCALGGKVLDRTAHQGQLAFKAGESLGGGIGYGIRGEWVGIGFRLRLKVERQFYVIGIGIHHVSPTGPCRLTGSAPS